VTDTATPPVVLIVVAAWSVGFVLWLLWDDIEAWWKRRRARAARRRIRPHRYVPQQRKAL
jgi:hypothetical protein